MIFLIFFLWAVFALTFPIGKILIYKIGALELVFVRMLSSGLFLLVTKSVTDFFLSSSKFFKNFSKSKIYLWLKSDSVIFLRVAFFHIFLAFGLEYWATKFLDPVKISLIFSLTPFVTALISFFVLNERFGPFKSASIIFSFFGAFLINSGNIFTKNISFNFSLPDFALLGAVFSGAYAWFEIKKLLKKNYSLLFINGASMVIGGLMCGMTHLIFSQSPKIIIHGNFLEFFFLMGLLIILSNIIGYNLYTYLLKFYSPTFLSLTGFLCPVFVGFYSWLIFGTSFNLEYFMGFILSLFAMIIFYLEDERF